MTEARAEALAAVVHTSQGEYRALVDRGLVEALGTEVRRAGVEGRVFIIADAGVYPVGVRRVQESLEGAGIAAHVLTLPAGESTKNLDTLRRIYSWLAKLRGERIDAILALGGGVVGDIAGFAAATWLRGVAFVQVPTTLAAMVDASLGGKVAANLPEGKNLVGAFHQPRLVAADVDFLGTLPRRELAAGWAEAIKHGLILDADLLATFERHADELLSLEGALAVRVIRRSVAIKAEVVSADEFETGDTRVLLNYGHTIGHAIEAESGYGRFLHGEAVSIGMAAAAAISERMGMIDRGLVERQRALLTRFGLPVSVAGLDPRRVLERTRSDKKSRRGAVRWVLLEGPGRAVARRDVPDDIPRAVVSEVLGQPPAAG